MSNVTQQVKEKDQEYRLNELKIKELRRQLPAKVLKPLDKKIGLQGGGLPKPTSLKKLGRPEASPINKNKQALPKPLRE